MKRAIVYAACIFIVSTAAAAPGSKLVQRFNETFPNAKNVKWIDDKAGYFVSFTQNENYNKVFYNKEGNFVYSLKYFSGDALPVNILMAINGKHDAAKIVGATELTTQNNTVYDVKLTKEDKIYCLNLLTDGTIIKEEEYINGGVK
jgi:hypothetical protein